MRVRPPWSRRLLTLILGWAGALVSIAPGAGAATVGPGQPTPSGAVPSVSASSVPPSPLPNSASGCNASVCIYITGSGTNVSSWQTTAYSSSAICTYARFLVNGTVFATSAEVCHGGGVSFSSTLNNPGYFPPGTQLCNTWAGLPGEPCEYIE